MKRAVIVHGWGGTPSEAWFPWLKRELEKNDFEVQVPEMPDTENPKMETWIPQLAKIVGTPNEDTYLIGHSMGCQTIVRYLESLPDDVKIGGAVFVAGFFDALTGLNEEETLMAKPWLETPIDFEKVKKHTKGFVAILSDNDQWVPLNNKEKYEERLGAAVVVEHNKEHFGSTSGVTELPSALNAVLDLAK